MHVTLHHGMRFAPSRPWLKCQYKGTQPSSHQRCFSAIVSPKTDEVKVDVGSSGPITLNINHPPRPSSSGKVLLYLPRGPLAQETVPEPSNLSSIALASNATVVRLNYRLSTTHPYPVPIHDVLAGYDWIIKHLVLRAAAHNAWQTPSRPVGLGVCGELIGGSLVAMLALTESHTTKVGIRAAAVNNPVTDWTAFFPTTNPHTTLAPDTSGNITTPQTTPKKRSQTNKPPLSPHSWTTFSTNPHLPASFLLRARSALFPNPETYFDHFASPLLFFRTPSSELPSRNTPISSEASSDASSQRDSDVSDTSLAENKQGSTPIRRSHRRHPPFGSGLRIPRMRVTVGAESVVKDQGIELAEGMRRSIGLYGGQSRDDRAGYFREVFRSSNDERIENAERSERIELVEREGVGLWSEEEDLIEVGTWFDSVLR